MCEPIVINGGTIGPITFTGTGLSVAEHQHRTVANLLELAVARTGNAVGPGPPRLTLADYLRCVDLYQQAGVDLTAEPLVGLGSVCRRQATDEATRIVTTLAGLGLRLHGFGFKTLGLRSCARARVVGLARLVVRRTPQTADARPHPPQLRQLPALRPALAYAAAGKSPPRSRSGGNDRAEGDRRCSLSSTHRPMPVRECWTCSAVPRRRAQVPARGFHVTGVDIAPQPNYCGDVFVQADAIEYAAAYAHLFDFVHSSPPCQDACALTKGTNKGRVYPRLIALTRDVLTASGVPFVIENVAGAELRRDLRLCGEMFRLAVIRHRYFEIHGLTVPQPEHLPHRGRVAGMRHGQWFEGPYFAVYGEGGGKGTVAANGRTAMGIDWTNVRRELAEAIPPAYTHHIGGAVRTHLGTGPNIAKLVHAA
ncbi:deazapurine DNA modification protein DpdA family protein [Yinghuangia aomiensis]